jgi:Zn-dependent protease/CBS domain-containing protein
MTAASTSAPAPRAREASWSLTVARVFGIPIRIHATFLVLVAWVVIRAVSRASDGAGTSAAVHELIVLGCVFGIVALHELGHALVARRYGVATKDITLLPIGGVARLDRIPKEPAAELWISLGGPLVNVLLAAAFFALASVRGEDVSAARAGDIAGPLVPTLAWINVSLAVFNLVPAFPMDGGRALRALLSTRTSRARATHIAARIGQGFALLLGLAGLLGNPMLVFIALFVWIGAADEASTVEREEMFQGMAAERAMMTETHVLTPAATLADVAARVIEGWQRDFPVLEGSIVRGVVTRERLIEALAKHGAQALVTAALDERIVTATRKEPLNDVMTRLRETNAPAALVMEDGRLVGLITVENVLELFAFNSALSARR